MLPAPVAEAMAGSMTLVEVAAAVRVGLLIVVAASVVAEVMFQPVGLTEYELLVVVAFAQVKYFVMVVVVEKEEVTVIVVSPDQSPAGKSAMTAGVSSSTSAATAELMRIFKE